MKRSIRPRRIVGLSESLHHRLNSYALAASAAGVGMLALARPADGRIVYTHTNKKIVNNLPIDLNHDGIVDFSLSFSSKRTSMGNYTVYLNAVPRSMNGVVSSGKFAADLPSGVTIDSQQDFASGPKIMGTLGYSHGHSACYGPWINKKRYLGFKFDISGEQHYGWASLGLWCSRGFGGPKLFGHLRGYAYETIPNKPIITGKTKGPDVIAVGTGSLGALAAGAAGRQK